MPSAYYWAGLVGAHLFHHPNTSDTTVIRIATTVILLYSVPSNPRYCTLLLLVVVAASALVPHATPPIELGMRVATQTRVARFRPWLQHTLMCTNITLLRVVGTSHNTLGPLKIACTRVCLPATTPTHPSMSLAPTVE